MVKIMSKDIKMIDRIINDLNVVRNTLTANEATIDYLSKRNKELENQVCELESARRINDSNIVRLSKKLHFPDYVKNMQDIKRLLKRILTNQLI